MKKFLISYILICLTFISILDSEVKTVEIENFLLPIDSGSYFELEGNVVSLEQDKEPEINLEELSYLSAVIYCESAANASKEAMAAIGWVVDNRLNDPSWGCSSYKDVILKKNPTQFSVTLLKDWDKIVETILLDDSDKAKAAVSVAKSIMSEDTKYKIPEDVQYFCSESKSFNHKYFDTFDGNNFYFKGTK